MKKSNAGTIARWGFAALFALAGIGSFSAGIRGVIAGTILLAAGFLMSPLSTQMGLFGAKSVLAVGASVFALLIGSVILPHEDKPSSEEPPSRIIVAEQDSADSDAPDPSTAETTASQTNEDNTSKAAETTVSKIEPDTPEPTADIVPERGIPTDTEAETGSAATTTKETTTQTTTGVTTKQTTQATTKATTKTTTKATTTATAATAAASALKVTSFPAIVYRNQDVTLSAQGSPNTEYTLNVYYSSGASTAEGLGKKTTDRNGRVSWSWQIGGRTNPGNYHLTISGGGERIRYDFTVENS